MNDRPTPTKMQASQHEFEAEPGLPEGLPPGEEILWQGAPDWRSLARHVFYTRWVAAYFGIFLVWRLTIVLLDSPSLMSVSTTVFWLLIPAFAAIGMLCFLGWLNARATIYTITNRRIVIRLGVALQLTVNMPFSRLQSADLSLHSDGSGDIALTMSGAEDIGYVMMWPHVRPWHFGEAFQPMLRSVPDADRVAMILVGALRASEPTRMQPMVPANVPGVAAPPISAWIHASNPSTQAGARRAG